MRLLSDNSPHRQELEPLMSVKRTGLLALLAVFAITMAFALPSRHGNVGPDSRIARHSQGKVSVMIEFRPREKAAFDGLFPLDFQPSTEFLKGALPEAGLDFAPRAI